MVLLITLLSPAVHIAFNSIPAAMWWFAVTATTVGYGDTYPTSTGGKFCAAAAMLTGVLVIAFPVSIFSDLWQEEMKNRGHENGNENVHGDRSPPTPPTATNGSSPKVMIEKDDLRALAECMRVIREKEDRLVMILSKYNINEEIKDILESPSSTATNTIEEGHAAESFSMNNL